MQNKIFYIVLITTTMAFTTGGQVLSVPHTESEVAKPAEGSSMMSEPKKDDRFIFSHSGLGFVEGF